MWILTGIVFLRATKFDIRRFVKQNYIGLILSLALTIIVFVGLPPQLRLHSDETTPLAVSQSMLREQRIDMVRSAVIENNEWTALNRALPHRALLFPFLVHLIHYIKGYSVDNVFIINFLAFFFFLLFFYQILNNHIGSILSASSALLICCQPILLHSATSGISDLLFITLLMIVYFLTRAYLSDSSKATHSFLWANLLLLCYTRYEAVLILLSMLPLMLLFKRIKLLDAIENPIVVSTPILLAPLFFQRLITNNDFKHYVLDPGGSVFSIKNFLDHNLLFVKNVFSISSRMPYANPINVLGLLSLSVLIIRWVGLRKDQRLSEHLNILSMTIIVNVCLLWTTITSYTQGEFTRFEAGRFYLPFLILWTAAIAILCRICIKKKSAEYVILLVSMIAFFLYFSIAIKANYTKNYFRTNYYKIVTNYIKHNRINHFLLVSRYPYEFTIHNWASINVDQANRMYENLKSDFEKKIYEKIIIVEERDKRGSIIGGAVRQEYSKKEIFKTPYVRNTNLHIFEVDRDLIKNQSLQIRPIATVSHKEIKSSKSILISPDGKKAFVANLSKHNVVIIDTEKRKVLKSIALDGRACEMATTKDGKLLFVSLAALEDELKTYPQYLNENYPGWEKYNTPAVILVVDPFKERDEVIKRIPVEVKPKVIALSPDNNYMAVSNFISGTLSVIRMNDLEVIASVDVGTFARGVCFSPDGKEIYVAKMSSGGIRGQNNISVVNLESLQVTQTITQVGNPRHLTAAKNSDYIYVSSFEKRGSVKKVSTKTKQIVGSAQVGMSPKTIALTSDDRYLLCGNYRSDDISVIDADLMKEVRRFSTGKHPAGLSIAPHDKELWVVCDVDRKVYVYNLLDILNGINKETK